MYLHVFCDYQNSVGLLFGDNLSSGLLDGLFGGPFGNGLLGSLTSSLARWLLGSRLGALFDGAFASAHGLFGLLQRLLDFGQRGLDFRCKSCFLNVVFLLGSCISVRVWLAGLLVLSLAEETNLFQVS